MTRDAAALRGAAATLVRWFDDRFRAMAIDAGAVECHFPAAIQSDTLARAGYFDAFPDGATPIGEPQAAGFFLPPAVCYHAYPMLAAGPLTRPQLLTATQPCFREADRGSSEPGRLWPFTMREIIFVGPEGWVAGQRRHWTAATETLCQRLRLDASIEPATDPFFGSESRGRRLMQQLKHLKDELRLPLGDGSIAAASFNSHETFFAERFGIRLDDGTLAHSGCAAFGLERWALAFLSRRGEAAVETLRDF